MKNLKTKGVSFAQAKLKAIIAITIIAIVGFSMSACVINMGDDSSDQTSPLNGFWQRRDSNGDNCIIEIRGSTGYLRQIDTSNPTWNSALNNGYFKIGDILYKDISKTGDNKWISKEFIISGNYPNFSSSWVDGTFTMNSNGQSFQGYAPSIGFTYTYTKQ